MSKMPNTTQKQRWPLRVRIFQALTLIPLAFVLAGLAVGVGGAEELVAAASVPLGAYGIGALIRPHLMGER
ncbi:hypothetical protein [Nguyenibacter sp. L1]|uniref:hypothetical protein n=1 Tax=Nguyenibacter sp. L1 TaxID=3049350 RepID=UPI002B46D8AA|nr:hypothetical protein [Nguyenibacter sp. L1]WRH89573.1 hypothetical protein QN315_08285 [Nguyenibacter sp. L1]